MATEKLFGNDITPMCKYCGEAVQQVGDNMLCLKRGIVPPDYACKRFDYDPIKRVPPRPVRLETYTQADFDITLPEGEN